MLFQKVQEHVELHAHRERHRQVVVKVAKHWSIKDVARHVLVRLVKALRAEQRSFQNVEERVAYHRFLDHQRRLGHAVVRGY